MAVLLCACALSLTACLHRNASHPTPAELRSSSAERGYIDLQPGWNVRVVFPRLRSGGYVLPSMQQGSVSGNAVAVQAGSDFLGYEKDFYKVELQRGAGIAVQFSHAEIWENDRTSRRSQPGLLLFPNAGNWKYIRLVYLTRESVADHDMAIISAMTPDILDISTQAVIRRAECKSDETAWCAWVPKGVAVDPEK